MNFDWHEYFTLAEWLYQNPDSGSSTEAIYRTVISRAYYAAFHCALELAEEEGYTRVYQAADHVMVASHFLRKGRTRIADRLNKLRDNRREADYESQLGKRPQVLANYTLSMARDVLQRVDVLRGE